MMMKLLNCDCSGAWHAFAPFFLRIATGAIFVAHGWQKFVGGVPGVAGFLGSLGFPMPEVFAVILITAELGGGILLILGAFTHWVAKILAVVALVALVVVHLPNGFTGPGGYEFILLILAAAVSLMITGAGKWSVDARLRKKN
jgi:putative oxidoreductase